jgi:hypothetical protein
MKIKNNIYLWLIIAGPSMVIVASIITIYIAHKSPNIILENYENDGGKRAASISSTNHQNEL